MWTERQWVSPKTVAQNPSGTPKALPVKSTFKNQIVKERDEKT